MLEEGIHEVGKIKTKNKLVVSDPCYTLNTWCLIVLNNMLEGNYRCFFERNEDSGISESWIVHENYKVNKETIDDFVDYIGVDSGQAGYFDYEYFEKYSDLKSTNPDKYNEEYYLKICNLTYSYFEEIERNSVSGGITSNNEAFVTSSGYGDGCYECFVKRNKENKIIAVKIVFIEYDDEDEEFEEDEE